MVSKETNGKNPLPNVTAAAGPGTAPIKAKIQRPRWRNLLPAAAFVLLLSSCTQAVHKEQPSTPDRKSVV